MDNLVGKSKKGFTWDLLGSVVTQAFALGISIILARLLTPEEFGIIGIALVFTSLTEVFVDVGFSSGLIYKQDLDERAYSSIFYVNISLSVLFSGIIFFIAPYIGDFYSSREISSVLRFISIIPMVAALGKVHSAILVKQLDFKSLTIRDVGAKLVGGVAGIIAALNNFGVFSLVVQHIVTVVIGTSLLWVKSKWVPKLTFSWSIIKSLTSYSMFVFFENLIRLLFNRIDTLAIGKFFSPATLGFYSRAESLNSQVTTYSTGSLRKIAFPLLSSIQDDSVRFESVFFKLLYSSSIVATYLSGTLLIFSREIIIFLFGVQWMPSIVIFKILLFKAAVSPFGALLGVTLLSKGFSKLKFKISLVQRAILVLPIILAIFFDRIEYFSVFVVVAFTVGILIISYQTYLVINISFKYQLRILIGTVGSLGVLSIPLYYFPEFPEYLVFLMFISGYTVYLCVFQKNEITYLFTQLFNFFKNKLKRI